MGKCTASCNGTTLQEDVLFKELESVIEEYRNRPGGLIPVLQITQNLFGYLPEEALKRISLGLDIPYSEIAGTASFYSFFSTVPRGRFTVRVCLGTACYVRGGKEVLKTFQKELGIDVGSTTEDRLFSLEVGRCFGACGLAPVVMIEDKVHQRVKPTKIAEILASYRQQAAGEEADKE